MFYCIGVTGGSCSGKSYVTQKIAKTASHIYDPDESGQSTPVNIVILGQDSYYKDKQPNYDVPEAVEWTLLVHHINELKNGRSVEVPIYSFETHTRTNKTRTVLPSSLLIIEGIMIFTQKEIRDLCNLKIYVSAYPELMYARRLKRDVEERGRDADEVNERYFRDVVPSSEHYTKPTMQYADIILMNNNKDEFVGLQILLDHIEKKLKQ